MKSQELILDSGCRSRIVCDKVSSVGLHDVPLKTCVNAYNSVSPVIRQSVAEISMLDKRGVSHVLNLGDCLHVPHHSRTLLRVSALGQKGAKVVFEDTCDLRSSDNVSFPFVRMNGLYVTKVSSIFSAIFSSTPKVNPDLWHCRLGHNIEHDDQKLIELVEGIKLHHSSFSGCFCDIFAENQLNRKSLSSIVTSRKSSKMQMVYSDVRVSIETTFLGGHWYVVSFIDSYNRFACTYFMKHKWEALEKFGQSGMDEGVPET